MRKIGMVVGVAMGIFMAVPVYADYKEQVRDAIRNELKLFYQRNEGNRISVDLMDGLSLHVIQIFEANRSKDDIIKESETPEAAKMPKGKDKK